MKHSIKLGNGKFGREGHLRDMFIDLEEFCLNDQDEVISKRLGHPSTQAAWDANPLVIRVPEAQGIYSREHKFA